MTSQQPDFWFPGSPYPVQYDFMNKAYAGISTGGICVLESPTGTGKSLSLICSSLSWLRDNRAFAVSRRIQNMEDSAVSDLPSWIRCQAETKAMQDANEIIAAWDEYKATMRGKVGRIGVVRTNCVEESNATGIKRKHPGSMDSEQSVDDDEFIAKDESTSDYFNVENTGTDRRVKVIIASRTHSQISQLLKELKRTKYKDIFNVVTLGSRSQLCVNPCISKNSASNIVNDQCRRLVDDNRCDFKKSTEHLKQLIISTPMDIEEMFSAGRAIMTQGCPYYATREVEQFADVLMVPHSSLVNGTTRDALGIDLTDNIVVIDEAHSILDLMNASRSVALYLSELELLLPILVEYLRKYATRLSPKNLVAVKQLQFLCKRLSVYGRDSITSGLVTIEAFMMISKVGEIDIASVLILLESNQFARKLAGFSRTLSENGSESNSIYAVLSILLAIHTSCDSDRVFVKRTDGASVSVQFVAIDAESELAKMALMARAVLLVSGTLKPFNEYEAVAELAGCPFNVFAGRYNVDESRLLSRVVTMSPSGAHLTYNSQCRSQLDHTSAFVEVVEMCLQAKPSGGIVIFTSSYAYCAELSNCLRKSKVTEMSGLFVDSSNVKVADLLQHYSEAIATHGTAVLMSVVNGSLSEGIDFKDSLCRCVIVVGLPYPNPADMVLQERMSFFDRQHACFSKFPTGKNYYENKCIKAVNQAIGRAIRHSTDWSAIILLDSRYSRADVFQGISDWVRNVSKVSTNWNELTSEVSEFFAKNSKSTQR